jgi:hypothetical protein
MTKPTKEDKSLGQIHNIKRRRKGKHLTYKDRQFIEYLVKKAHPKKASAALIAEAVGCSE